MQFAQRFSDLPDHVFPRLRKLLADHAPGDEPLAMSIGEPKHALPDLLARTVTEHAGEFALYPPNDGAPELLAAIADWLAMRYGVRLDPETRILALNGTREGLFAAGLALCAETKAGGQPVVLMPNPFYQAYGAAALAAGAEPVAVPALPEKGFLPEFAALPAAILSRASLCYVGSPSNPQGAVADEDYWRRLIALAERHDFVVLADECYSEIYRDAPPPGALAAAQAAGADPERVMVFHSLSKRSNAPGLRSGFAAGGARGIAALKRLRAYGGAPLPLPLQRAATALWRDEAHVARSRDLYRAKFALADDILGGMPGYASPRAGFFLWLDVGDGERAAVRLWRESGVQVLPGGYLGRDAGAGNPGQRYIRVALVAERETVARGLGAIRSVLGEGFSTKRVS